MLVFLVHYSGPTYTLQNRPIWQYPWFLGCYLSMCAVPIFFALSGYLITGVLFDSKTRSGYFRVFYLRRIIRVFPLYYIALLVAFAFGLHAGRHLYPHDLLFPLYLHNWWIPSDAYVMQPLIDIGHLWSLAVEEQFYLVWPIIIWLLPNRKELLSFCYITIAVTFLARCMWPYLHLPPFFAYQNSIYRCDAIMMGSVLFLHQREAAHVLRRLVKPALLTLLLGSTVIVIRGLITSTPPIFDSFGIIVIQPITSLMGTAFIVLALAPGTLVNRISQWNWAVYLGKRSYGMYVFHQFFLLLVLKVLSPALIPHLGRGLARGIGALTGFALTFLVASLMYRFVETPALNVKQLIRYGSPRPHAAVIPVNVQKAA